jgi:hypothetical protein
MQHALKLPASGGANKLVGLEALQASSISLSAARPFGP